MKELFVGFAMTLALLICNVGFAQQPPMGDSVVVHVYDVSHNVSGTTIYDCSYGSGKCRTSDDSSDDFKFVFVHQNDDGDEYEDVQFKTGTWDENDEVYRASASTSAYTDDHASGVFARTDGSSDFYTLYLYVYQKRNGNWVSLTSIGMNQDQCELWD